MSSEPPNDQKKAAESDRTSDGHEEAAAPKTRSESEYRDEEIAIQRSVRKSQYLIAGVAFLGIGLSFYTSYRSDRNTRKSIDAFRSGQRAWIFPDLEQSAIGPFDLGILISPGRPAPQFQMYGDTPASCFGVLNIVNRGLSPAIDVDGLVAIDERKEGAKEFPLSIYFWEATAIPPGGSYPVRICSSLTDAAPYGPFITGHAQLTVRIPITYSDVFGEEKHTTEISWIYSMADDCSGQKPCVVGLNTKLSDVGEEKTNSKRARPRAVSRP